MEVPLDILHGASTQRAVMNFPISGRPVPAAVIQAFAHLKEACAQVNLELGRLEPPVAEAIARAAQTIRGWLEWGRGRWCLDPKVGRPWITFRWMCSKPAVAPAPT